MRRVLVFELAEQSYALRCQEIEELLLMAALSQPAGRPPILEGFLTLGSRTLPVLDLRRLFSQPRREPELYTPLIVLRHGLILMVDRVVAQTALIEAECTPADPAHSLNGCITERFRHGGEVVNLLDAGSLLLEQERHCLDALQALEEERLRALS